MKKIYTLLCFYILFCANVFSAVPVTDWLLLGPIQSTPDQMFSRPYLPEETILPNLNESFGDMKWIKATAGNNGIVDLYSALSAERSKRYLVAYACAYVYSEYDMPAQLLMGSDDGLQVWLNGLKVWQINVNRGTNAGEDVVNVMLSKGLNCLLLKINQDYEGWSFCCSVASDYPVKGVIMNPMKIVSKPATTTKVWIPELSFRSTVSGSTDVNLRLFNSRRESIQAVSISMEHNGSVLAEKTISPLVKESMTTIAVPMTNTQLAGWLSQDNPVVNVKVNNDNFQEQINSDVLYSAMLGLSLVSANPQVKSYAEKIRGMNLLFGRPNNVREESKAILISVRDGKADDMIAGLKKIYDSQAIYLSDHSKENVHVVGHGHLDMNWLWPTAETKKASHDNLRQTVAFMEEFPDFTMLQSQAAIYKQVEMQDPDLFRKMQKYVAEGRLEPVGGMWSEGDCNLTSGEAIIRSFLLGQTYYQLHFGKTAKVGFLPDNFGHPSQLPQILKLAGIDYFYFMRCRPHQGTFWWYGPDSSRVLSYSAGAYNGAVDPSSMNLIREASPEKKRILLMAGVGDHGGGPTRKDIDNVHIMAAVPNYSKIRFTTAQDFFKASTGEMDGRPSHTGEMQYILEGCYTSVAEIKEANRNSERILYQAELMASLDWLINRNPYPSCEFRGLWEMVAYNQFHDILPGSAIFESYKEAVADHYSVQKNAAEIRDEAFRSLSDKIKFRTDMGQPVVVYNMHPAGRMMLVEAEFFTHEKPLTWNPNGWYDYYISNRILPLNVGQGNAATVLLRDGTGKSYPAQIVWSKLFPPGYRSRVMFLADSMPACGYRTFYVDASKPGTVNDPIPFKPTEFETDQFSIGFDSHSGDIIKFLDKRSNMDYAGGKVLGQLKVYMEKGGDAWVIGKTDHIEDITDVRSFSIPERGPVRACVEAVNYWRNSKIIQRTYVYRSYPRVDVELEIHWFERSSDSALSPFLKAVFPFAIANPDFNCHVPFDVVKRPVNGQEVPAQQWVDISDGKNGMALLNTTKYGHSYNNGQLEFSLLRTTHYPDRYPNLGVYTVRYSLYPHSGDWKRGVWAEAEDFNVPAFAAEPLSLSQGREKAVASDEASLISVDPATIVMSGIKQSEDGKELIIRLAEVEGNTSVVHVTLPSKVKKARRLNIIEQPLGGAETPAVSGNKVTIAIKPHEIVTLGIKF